MLNPVYTQKIGDVRVGDILEYRDPTMVNDTRASRFSEVICTDSTIGNPVKLANGQQHLLTANAWLSGTLMRITQRWLNGSHQEYDGPWGCYPNNFTLVPGVPEGWTPPVTRSQALAAAARERKATEDEAYDIVFRGNNNARKDKKARN